MSVATPNGIDRESVPEEPIETVRLTRSVAVGLVLVSVVAAFASAYAFALVLAAVRGAPLEPIVLTARTLSNRGLLLGAIGLGLVAVGVHELLHGAFMSRYGDSPSYGIGVSAFVPYAYARGGPASYERNQLLVVLLAPLAVVTAAGTVAMVIHPSPVWIVPLSVNAAGSVGDLWMALALVRYPPGVRVGDHPRPTARGFGIYAPDGLERRPGAAALSRILAGATGTTVALAALLGGLVVRSLAVGTGTVVVAVDGWTVFRHELHTTAVVLEVGVPPLAALATGGGLAWALLGAVRDALAKP